MDFSRIRRLALTNFRSYRAASIELSAEPVVLVGANGAGKTNLIEAISFLTPGRGLRRATLEEVAFSEGDGSWAVPRWVPASRLLLKIPGPSACAASTVSRSLRWRISPTISG